MSGESLQPQDVIRKKRDGAALSTEEIAFFVRGVAKDSWGDYQATALLMAIFLNGMTEAETHALTREMLYSGEVLNFSEIEKPKVDKHSTGGVGDKTSLIIAPIAAACGLCVPMISGRGLGHTGGTLDKLEAIPGFRVSLSHAEFRRVLKRVGFAMAGQTKEIAPADRKLYALRDATATVEALPLIVASIMSKKLAAGLDALVLDVKTGSGAFMSDETRARELAHALVKTGEAFGVRTEALITDMNQPLGIAVGNALEVRECLAVLRNEAGAGTRPLLKLSIELAGRMIALGDSNTMLEDARRKATRALESGAALERFRLCVEAQGGDARVCDDPSLLSDLTLRAVHVESARSGFVRQINAAEIGRAVASIGGGRTRVEDQIDPAVGFLANAKINDELTTADRALGVLYCRNETQAEEASARIRAAYEIADEPASNSPELIREVINS